MTGTVPPVAAETDPLERIARTFALSQAELGQLFGVDGEAIKLWRTDGVPAQSQRKVEELLAVCDLLERKLKPGRIPQISRRPAAAYGGRTMLEMISDDEHHELLASTRNAFDWSRLAG
jgi:hypothetical protein